MDFVAARYAHVSPLAKKLFGIDGVNRVFYGKDHIAVSKKEDLEWEVLKPQIYSVISEFFSSPQELFTDEPQPEDTTVKEGDSDVVITIKEIIDTRVRPVVQEDGGDITYRGFDPETGVVKVTMKGSCAGCPSSSVTLKQGIEKMLTHYVPEVNSVEAVDYDGE
eukprot:CAMPEP_0176413922 /NCGR_PEP_ID=MMETSP0127-20121128/4965_1 /TAXON_ID=938130 /ORGANISM="Platyophrya macrostoma, Strain WH" /LENGTH=163 /DNA_ID=CAMNT_0017793751 /DNA_START=150 /DNA_END=641 /DNA_ORIENTATION=-